MMATTDSASVALMLVPAGRVAVVHHDHLQLRWHENSRDVEPDSQPWNLSTKTRSLNFLN